MRIKVGMQVEALVTEEATNMGAWRAGEVIWGNGHSYVMRWSDGGPNSARISRKFVRPSPDPDAELPEDLDAGDIVELFDDNLWKWAEVLRVVDGRQFDVKFVGSTRVITADRSALRPRLIYGEKGWTLIHKNDQIAIESAVPSRPIAGKNIKSKAIGSNLAAAHAAKLGKTKRSDYGVEADVVRDAKRFRGNGDTYTVFAKREGPAARYSDNTGHYLEKRQQTGNNADHCFLARRTDKGNEDDDASSSSETSSSSSSGSNSSGGDRTVSATAEHCRENQEAEIQRLPPSRNEEEKEERHGRSVVHDLELEAYVSVMRAFRATGSLSWSREELLCNLRLHLHVSSDEHLQVICRLNGTTKPAAGPRSGRC